MTGPTAEGVLVAGDLDRTLIYSPSALFLAAGDHSRRLLCVELHEGRPLSFVTETAARDLAVLNEAGVLRTVTTRTPKQYRRILLPGPTPRLALCANGGRLLRDGVEDAAFARRVEERLAASGAPHAELLAHLRAAADPGFVEEVKDAVGLFCYALVARARVPEAWLVELTGSAAELGWGVSLQGRKLYLVPHALSKGAAARELADECGAGRLLAAGDSLLDADLLDAADDALRPAHGELHEQGFLRPHLGVTGAVGVLAGEEIAGWMRREAGLGAGPG